MNNNFLLGLFSLLTSYAYSVLGENIVGLEIPKDAVGRPKTPERNLKLLQEGKVFGVRDIPENRCYCTYGHEGGVCDSNFTCIKHDLAACFHAVEEMYNKEEKRMETWHKFGCAPLEKGSDASHLTCNGWRSTHFVPKSIACCYDGNYCNKHIEPPPYQGINETDWESLDTERIVASKALLVFTGTVIASITVVTASAVTLYLWIRLNKSKKAKGCDRSEEDPMLCEDSGSGSGSGRTTLNQRTVAQDLTRIKVIGRGRYGEVKKALYRGSYVAVKTFYTTDEESWKNEKDVYNTQMLNHENILRKSRSRDTTKIELDFSEFVAADICSEDSITQMLLITDYHSLGSLCDYLRREEHSLSVQEAVRLAHSSICGVEHLHTAVHGTGSRRKPEIAHRDLKSKNIIVKRPGVCCIADFGLAVRWEDNKLIPEKVNVQVGTRRYMAPEVLAKTLNPTSFDQFKRADIYSFGLVMWEIVRRVEWVPKEQEAALGESSDSSGLGDSETSETGPKMHMHKTSMDMSRAHPYVPPFDGLVQNDPSLEEMKILVCDQGMRPPIEDEWRNAKNEAMFRVTSLLIDCWHARASFRHSALKIKFELNKIIDSLNNQKALTNNKTPENCDIICNKDSGIGTNTYSTTNSENNMQIMQSFT